MMDEVRLAYEEWAQTLPGEFGLPDVSAVFEAGYNAALASQPVPAPDLGAKPSVLVGQIAARFGLVVTDDPDFDHDDETFEKALVGFAKELSECLASAALKAGEG